MQSELFGGARDKRRHDVPRNEVDGVMSAGRQQAKRLEPVEGVEANGRASVLPYVKVVCYDDLCLQLNERDALSPKKLRWVFA